MKKFLSSIMMTVCIGLLASCSQEEIISGYDNGEVETVSVSAQLPGNTVNTRALPTAPENHQLRCILEVWDKEGNKVLERIEKLASEADGDKLQFTFSVPVKTDYQCLLWADYIDPTTVAPAAEGNTKYTDKHYNTENLKAIDFKVTGEDLFNNAASDAFCGVVAKNGTTTALSVTLKRPFTKVTLKDKSDYINDCKSLTVTYNTPSGYDIVTGKASGTKQVVATLTPNKENKTWFSTFIFASTDKQTLDQDIKMEITKTDDSTETKTIKAGGISLDSNVENNAEANFDANSDITVDVDINDKPIDPNAPKVGQFLLADGTTSDAWADNAIGIVFATTGKTDNSEYNKDGKTITGYAMALTSVGRKNNVTDPEGTFPTLTKTGDVPFEDNDYNGYSYTTALLNCFIDYSTPLFQEFKTWKTTNAIDEGTTNLSEWYIPSGRQLLDLTGMALGYEGNNNASAVAKNEAFAAAYTTAIGKDINCLLVTNGNGSGLCNHMSSYVTSTANVASVQIQRPSNSGNINTITETGAFANKCKDPFDIRPVITIFNR